MRKRNCVNCGKEFDVDDLLRNWQHKKLCSTECQKQFSAKQKRESYTPVQWPQKKICLWCNSDFQVHKGGNMAQKYCSLTCQEAVKDDRRLRAQEARRQAKHCPECGNVFIPGKHTPHKQIYCSLKCRQKARHKQQYQSGASRSKIRNGYKRDFRILRMEVFKRDEGKCFVCSGTEKTHAHHLDNSGGLLHPNNSMENLATMCSICHYAIHGITLCKVNDEWVLDGKIFGLLGLSGSVKIK